MSVTGEKADHIRTFLFGDGSEDRLKLIYIVTGVTSCVSVQECDSLVVNGGT